jgi:hypothetical protein
MGGPARPFLDCGGVYTLDRRVTEADHDDGASGDARMGR